MRTSGLCVTAWTWSFAVRAWGLVLMFVIAACSLLLAFLCSEWMRMNFWTTLIPQYQRHVCNIWVFSKSLWLSNFSKLRRSLDLIPFDRNVAVGKWKSTPGKWGIALLFTFCASGLHLLEAISTEKGLHERQFHGEKNESKPPVLPVV